MVNFWHPVRLAVKPHLGLFFRWWLTELGGFLPGKLRAKFEGTSKIALLERDGDLIHLRLVSRRMNQDIATIATDDPAFIDKLRALLRMHNSDQRNGIGILLDRSQIFSREIDLPRGAEARLTELLRFEVERRTPYRLDEVVFGGKILSHDTVGGRLRVRMYILPTEELREWRRIVESVGSWIREIYESHCGTLPHEVISLTPHSMGRRNFWLKLQLALAALALMLLGTAKWWELSTLSAAIDQMHAEITAGKDAVQHVTSMEQELQKLAERGHFLQSQQKRLSALQIFDQLAAILPDDTWLMHAHIAYPDVTISGYSANTTAAMGALNNSAVFHDPRYQTPITIANDRQERFDIAITIINGGVR